jgi:hypothetical protein
MTGIEFITLLLCLVLSVVLIATAWWVAGIHTLLERLAIGLETWHIERSAERSSEKRTLDTRQKHFFQWLAETASTLKGLHSIAEKCAERPDTMVMTSPHRCKRSPCPSPCRPPSSHPGSPTLLCLTRRLPWIAPERAMKTHSAGRDRAPIARCSA